MLAFGSNLLTFMCYPFAITLGGTTEEYLLSLGVFFACWLIGSLVNSSLSYKMQVWLTLIKGLLVFGFLGSITFELFVVPLMSIYAVISTLGFLTGLIQTTSQIANKADIGKKLQEAAGCSGVVIGFAIQMTILTISN